MNARSLAITRAVAVIGGTGALIVGATFAATVGSVSLTGNTFSAIQGLQISNGGAFGDTATGFSFGSLSQGSASGTAKSNFYLEDTTGGTSALHVSVAGANYGSFSGLDLNKVNVNIELDGGTKVDSATLEGLASGTLDLSAANRPAVGGAATKYDIWLTMDSGGITDTTQLNPANNTFDLTFTGSN